MADKTKKYTQTDQVIDAMERLGGYAHLGNLYQEVDISNWGTKTPHESIRRILQKCDAFFRIQPGLWALSAQKDAILAKFDIKSADPKAQEIFTHGYYQGLLLEIGNMKNFTTYVPAQDQNRKFLETPLKDICSTIEIPKFGYDALTSRARTVDVIWFNKRQMPDSFFEV